MKKNLLLAAAGAIILGCGCQNSINTVENADKNMTPQVIRDSRFVTDGFLRDRLALTRVVTAETPDGLLQVQIEAMNVRTGTLAQAWSSVSGGNPYRIRYKFTWFDLNGMAIDSLMSDWRDITVIPGETVYLRSVAPTKDCKDFRVSLQEAK